MSVTYEPVNDGYDNSGTEITKTTFDIDDRPELQESDFDVARRMIDEHSHYDTYNWDTVDVQVNNIHGYRRVELTVRAPDGEFPDFSITDRHTHLGDWEVEAVKSLNDCLVFQLRQE